MRFHSVLLAAGLGTRLRPLTDRVPKAAVPVLDVPLGAWGLAGLVRRGGPIAVNVAHRPEAIRAALGRAFPGAEVAFVEERPEPYGSGGTLAALRPRLAYPVLTVNCDVISDLDPDRVLEAHRRVGAPATVAVVPVPSGADVIVEGDRAVGFVDRRDRSGPSGGRFMGVAAYDREALDLIPDIRPVGVAETVLRELAAAGELAVINHRGYFADVGTPAAYLRTSLDVLERRAPQPPVPIPGRRQQAATGTRGRPRPTPGGHVYVGPGARAPADALRAGAILLSGAVVADGAVVTRAIVCRGETVSPGTELTDDVWMQGRRLLREARGAPNGRQGP